MKHCNSYRQRLKKLPQSHKKGMLLKKTNNKKEIWREAIWNAGCAEAKKAVSQTGASERTEDWKRQGIRQKEGLHIWYYAWKVWMEILHNPITALDREAMKTYNARKKERSL